MTSPVNFHAGPAAGFDQPFEMLAACHERVERMLGLLERLAGHLASTGADAQAAQAAQDVMRYFDLAGPAHHEDEERHVFPVLRQRGDAAAVRLVDALQRDHEAMAAGWPALRADLQRVAAADGAVGLDAATLRRWADYAALYRRHIAAEDGAAYPAVRALQDAGARAAMGREMAQRRGLPGA